MPELDYFLKPMPPWPEPEVVVAAAPTWFRAPYPHPAAYAEWIESLREPLAAAGFRWREYTDANRSAEGFSIVHIEPRTLPLQRPRDVDAQSGAETDGARLTRALEQRGIALASTREATSRIRSRHG